MKTIILLLFSMLLFAFSARAQDPNFHIYLAFGQSNMEGHAKIEPQDTVAISERFKVLSAVECPDLDRKKGEWYTAKPPLCRCNSGLVGRW